MNLNLKNTFYFRFRLNFTVKSSLKKREITSAKSVVCTCLEKKKKKKKNSPSYNFHILILLYRDNDNEINTQEKKEQLTKTSYVPSFL